MWKRKGKLSFFSALLLALTLVLGACGGSGGAAQTSAAATTAAAAAAATAAPAETAATAAAQKAETAKENKEAEKAQEAGDAGRYEIYEYEAGGNKVSHDMLVQAGMGDTWLELYEDGTGKMNLFQSMIDLTWKPGEITVYGTSKYTYEVEGDTLNLDMQGVYYTMKKAGSAQSASARSEESAGGAAEQTALSASGDEEYINDGTVEGLYQLYSMMGMSIMEMSQAFEQTPEEVVKGMEVEIKGDGTAIFSTDGEGDEVNITIDGEKVVMEAEGEELEGTLKDGLLILDIGGEEVTLARLTPKATLVRDKGEADIWTGAYTKFVGDDMSSANKEDKFSLELYEDGTGISHRDDLDLKAAWTLDGTDFTMQETFLGMTIDYTGTLDQDTLSIFNGNPEDDLTCQYVYTKNGAEPSEAVTGGSAGAAGTGTAAEAAAGASKDNIPSGVPNGDGLLSEEEVQKGYVWMSKVAKDIFNTTYEMLADHFGVDGEFDKEEYSDHMQRNKRYYKWISEENPNHFIYVNFDEKDAAGAPGVYTVSGFNSSGFTGSEAEAKYLEEVKAEASAADKAAAANMAMKDFEIEISPWGHKEDVVKIGMQIPESGWAYDEAKAHLVENEDIDTFGAGFIQFELEETVDKFDFYKDKFENYKEIDDREIGGVTFKGRTYKNIGYEWTEYIAQLDDSHAVSIGIVRVDVSEGSMGDKILGSVEFR